MSLLQCDNLSAGYGRSAALQGVALSVGAGECVAVLGANGSGKSTLLRALVGLTPWRRGAITWGGATPSSRSDSPAAAYLAQSPAYSSGLTVAQTILAGRYPFTGLLGIERESDADAARHWAQRVGVDGLLHQRIETLSGGQRQRVLIARALAQQPRVLLLDEPDTSLDLAHLARLAALLRSLCATEGLGIIACLHDLNFAAAVATRVLLLESGRVTADGPAAQIMTAERLSMHFATQVLRIPQDGRPPVFSTTL